MTDHSVSPDLREALRLLRREFSVDLADAILDGERPEGSDISDADWEVANERFRAALQRDSAALQSSAQPESREAPEEGLRERSCPACGAALSPADTHWNLMTDAYECPSRAASPAFTDPDPAIGLFDRALAAQPESREAPEKGRVSGIAMTAAGPNASVSFAESSAERLDGLAFAKALTVYGVHLGNCPYDSWNKGLTRCKCGLFALIKKAEAALAGQAARG